MNDTKLKRGTLSFTRPTLDMMPRVAEILAREASPSCDYTIGGIYMWIGLYDYEICIDDGELYVSGCASDGSMRPSFFMPVGRLPLAEAIARLRAHCRAAGVPLLLSAVPADALDSLAACGMTDAVEIDHMADYIYEAHAMAELKGKAYNKKRNHYNRFFADNPDARLEPLTAANAAEAAAFVSSGKVEADKLDNLMACYELDASAKVLADYADYPTFCGAVLRLADGRIAAVTAGEVSGDTLIVHIEKADHTIAGSGEAVASLFVRSMLEQVPSLRFVNREDDAGDPGLQRAKLSWMPVGLLRKYIVAESIDSEQ